MHCMIHRVVLVGKELSAELGHTAEVVTKVINFIKTPPLKSRVFQKLGADIKAGHPTLLFYFRPGSFRLKNLLIETANRWMNFFFAARK